MMGTNAYDGYFEVVKKLDGVYVEVYEAHEGGNNASLEEIEHSLTAMKVADFDLAGVSEKMTAGFDKIVVKVSSFVTGTIANGEEPFRIEITEDKMMAKITFYPSELPYSADLIERKLKGRGVLFGVNTELLEALAVEREYNTPYIVAEGRLAVDGKPASIEYMFKTEKDTRPEMDADGNVNYKKLNVIANVKQGQLLARLIPITPGEDGKNIYGDSLPPRMPKVVRLRYGKNIEVNSDKTELYAACDGLVKLFEGKVLVNNVYEVPNNVGPSTGDVAFEGTVIVHGNVLGGFAVKAKGDVEVLGAVEGAQIVSGGNITLHAGIQGMSKGCVEAAGNIQARYIENAEVIAGGDLHSEAILHSKISCKGKVTVEGKKGMISGGSISAGESVTTKVLGSHMGTTTTIDVGIDPIMLQEYAELKKSLPKMTGEVTKLEQVINLLNKRKELDGQLESDKQEMYMSAVRNKIFLGNKLKQAQVRFSELDQMVENKNKGSVSVSHELYPGVKISIGSVSTYIRDEISYVKLVKDGADIKMSSL